MAYYFSFTFFIYQVSIMNLCFCIFQPLQTMQQDMQTPQEMEHHQNQDINSYYHQMPSHTIHHHPNDQTNIPQPYIYTEHENTMHANVLQDQYDHQQTMYYNQSCNSIVS